MSTKNRFALWQGLIVIAGLLLSGISGWMLHQGEVRDARHALNLDVERRAQELNRMLASNVEPLQVIAALFDNGQPPTYTQFNKHAERILNQHQSIQAIEWIPKVSHADRVSFENEAQALFPGFQLRQRDIHGQMVKATDRSEYFPVYLITPIVGNEKAIGYDLTSNPTRLSSLTTSRETATQMASASISLVQEAGNSKGFLVFLPIYKSSVNRLIANKEVLSQGLLGFVLGVYRVDEIFYKSAMSQQTQGIALSLYDNTDGQHADLLLQQTVRSTVNQGDSVSYEVDLSPFYSRQWSLLARPTEHYINQYHTVAPLTVASLGTLLTLFTVFYLRMIYRQSLQVQKLVDDRTRELSLANQKLKQISKTDSLTGIANRRCMDSFLANEWARAKREQSALSIIMLDIDFFKQYNDNYGHQMGDECLQKVAQALAKMVGRPGDMVARYGGEEFCIIMAYNEDSANMAHKCQKAIEAINIPHQGSEASEFVTISAGYITIKPQQEMQIEDVLKAADTGLYLAKTNGRNRVEQAFIK